MFQYSLPKVNYKSKVSFPNKKSRCHDKMVALYSVRALKHFVAFNQSLIFGVNDFLKQTTWAFPFSESPLLTIPFITQL